MKRLLFICYCLLAVVSFSCKQKSPEIFLRNNSLSKGFEEAKLAKKGLLLISNKSGCSMCELFEVDLMKDESYAQKIYKDFVVQRIDENASGSKWLSRILNRGSFPIFLFFNQDRKLIGIEMGAVKKHQMERLLIKVAKNETWVDQLYQPGSETGMSAEKLLSYVANLSEAQYQWEQYSANKQISALNKIEHPLKESISIYPSFYNNYLLAKYYAAAQSQDLAARYAEAALRVENPAALYFNSGLRTELKMLINANYNVYEDAYMGLADVEQNLGKLKFGVKKSVAFPVKNIGKKDLSFSKIITDCECTVANYPKSPIKPGDTGIIHVNFTATRSGEFTHMLEIGANASNAPLQLTIKGLVLGD